MMKPVEDEQDIKTIVEHAVYRDDVVPLLRLLFKANQDDYEREKQAAAQAQQQAELAAAAAQQPDGKSVGAAAAAAAAVAKAATAKQSSASKKTLSELSVCLNDVANEQKLVVQELVSLHASEMVGMVTDMHDMQGSIGAMSGALTQVNDIIQGSAGQVATCGQGLAELRTVHSHVAGGLQGVKAARDVLTACIKVGKLLEEGQLYQALLLARDCHDRHLRGLMHVLDPSNTTSQTSSALTAIFQGADLLSDRLNMSQVNLGGGSSSNASSSKVLEAGTGGHGNKSAANTPGRLQQDNDDDDPQHVQHALTPQQVSNIMSVRAYCESQIFVLVAAAEALAISELHAWLVQARGLARVIGLRAVRQAAIRKQLDERLAQERRCVELNLQLGDNSLQALSTNITLSTFRRAIQDDQKWPKSSASKRAAGDDDDDDDASSGNGLLGKAMVQSLQRPLATPDVLSGLPVNAPHHAISELVEKWEKQQKRGHTKALKAAQQAQQQSQQAASSQPPSRPQHGRSQSAGLQFSVYGSLQPQATPEQVVEDSKTTAGLGAKFCVPSDMGNALLSGLPMQGLLRCMHIHKVLGRVGKLRDYYIEQRRLQLGADLSAPYVPFLEKYQAYVGQAVQSKYCPPHDAVQVLGFFVIEAGVRRQAPELITTPAAAQLWDSTAAQVKVVLERAMCVPGALLAPPPGSNNNRNRSSIAPRPSTPGNTTHSTGPGNAGVLLQPETADDAAAQGPVMVMVKEFVLLSCAALETHGCTSQPLKEVLLTASVRYHELLTLSAAAAVTSALQDDDLSMCVAVANAAQADQMCIAFGLPCRLHGQGTQRVGSQTSTIGSTPAKPSSSSLLFPLRHTAAAASNAADTSVVNSSLSRVPATPFHAPYTPLVPSIIQAIRSFVDDSASYLRGLTPPWELKDALMQHRDRVVHRSVIEALLGMVNRLAAGHQIRHCMQMVSNAWCLNEAVPALEQHLEDIAAPPAERDPEVVKLKAKVGQKYGSAASGGGVGGQGPLPGTVQPPGVPSHHRAKSSTASGNASALPGLFRLLLDTSERCTVRHVMRGCDAILHNGWKDTDWCPTTYLEPGPSPHMTPLMAHLQGSFNLAQSLMPQSSWVNLIRTVLQSVSLAYIKLFSPDGIKGYNLLIIEQLSYDVSTLQNFAARLAAIPYQDSNSNGTGTSSWSSTNARSAAAAGNTTAATSDNAAGHPLGGLAQQFASPQQLFTLLLCHQRLEEVLVPEVRRQLYPDLEPSLIVLALDKYKELSYVGKEKTGFPTKKTVDGLAKALRSQMVVGTAASVLQGF